MRKPKAGQNHKAQMKFVKPYEAANTVTGLSEIKQCTAFVDFVLPDSASATDKADMRNFVLTALSNAIIVDVVDNGAFPY